ncbi:MAG TPA: hypothetical protein VN158_15175, partial [Caulobacter sp.]|nr:hypothetical protein [Caulobacter sp.]
MTAQISPLPTPPSTNDPANFNTRGDAFLGQLPTFQAEANTLATEVNGLAVQVTNDKASTTASAASAAASSNSALNAPGTNGTSTTSQTVGTGTKTFTTQTGKAWLPGQGFFIASTASPLNQMTGVLTAYNGGTGAATVEVSAVLGSGTFASWNVGLSTGAPMAVASQAQAEGGTDATTVMTPQRTKQAIDKFAAQVADTQVTAASSLTSASKYTQNVAMGIRGAALTLPVASTLVAGPRFSVTNTGKYDLPIKNNAGATKAFVRAGQTATCYLLDNSTAAGVWAFDNTAIYGE